jgi:hypothetical protein
MTFKIPINLIKLNIFFRKKIFELKNNEFLEKIEILKDIYKSN